jgi:hypothetical protein
VSARCLAVEPGVERLHEAARLKDNEGRFTGPALSGDTRIGVHDIASGDQLSIICSSAEILIVAKLEKVSETAYGKMIVSLCRIAPHV